MTNFSDMLSKAKKVQEQMREVQENIKKIEVEGTAGGDLVKVILKGVPGEAYNIGNPNPEISVIQLIKKIESILGKQVNFNIVDYPDSYPADEPNRRCPDILKAKRQIRYQPKIEIDEGLSRFMKWSDSVYTGKQ